MYYNHFTDIICHDSPLNQFIKHHYMHGPVLCKCKIVWVAVRAEWKWSIWSQCRYGCARMYWYVYKVCIDMYAKHVLICMQRCLDEYSVIWATAPAWLVCSLRREEAAEHHSASLPEQLLCFQLSSLIPICIYFSFLLISICVFFLLQNLCMF